MLTYIQKRTPNSITKHFSFTFEGDVKMIPLASMPPTDTGNIPGGGWGREHMAFALQSFMNIEKTRKPKGIRSRKAEASYLFSPALHCV